MTLCSLSQPAEAKRPSDPYEKFLAEQKERNREWKSEREAKSAKVQSVTPAVKQNDASSADCDRCPEDPVTLLNNNNNKTFIKRPFPWVQRRYLQSQKLRIVKKKRKKNILK